MKQRFENINIYLKKNKKKIIILLIILYLLVFKICNVNALQITSSGVNAPTISVGYKTYIEESGNIFFTDTIDYVNLNEAVDTSDPYGNSYVFHIPSKSIMTHFFIDYAYNSVALTNETNDYQYVGLGSFNAMLNRTIIPMEQTCPFSSAVYDPWNYEAGFLTSSYMSFKNNNVLSCTYEDLQGTTHTCGDNLSWVLFSGSNTNFLVTKNNNSWFQNAGSYDPTTREQNTYYKNTWYYPNENYGLYFKIAPNTTYKNIKITLGGIGNYSGTIDGLNSYGNTSDVNLYYNNYQLLRDCTFSSTDTLLFQTKGNSDLFSLSNSGYLTSSQYNNFVSANKVIQYTQSGIEQLISNQTSSGELAKEFAMQQTLIGDDPVAQEEELDGVLSTIQNGLGSSIVGQTSSLFQSIFSKPIELLDELADHDTCESYHSQVYGVDVTSSLNLTLPFTHDTFSLSCSDVNFIGRTPEQADQGLQFNIVYHGFITGILCYYCVLTYMVFIKSLFNLKDNNVEVLEI